ncbi:MAG: hypothetical protein K1V96_07875 [Lachnospiraceae bacterium]
MKRKKRNHYKFAGKKHSKRGKISLVLGLFSILLGISMVIFSVECDGNASVYIGSIGLFAMILSAISLLIGITSFREESYKLFPILGSICSGCTLAGWLAIYMLGLYM